MWDLQENILVSKRIFLSHISTGNESYCRKMCWNKTRKIPLSLSIMRKTKAETVNVCHHACLLCCLLTI